MKCPNCGNEISDSDVDFCTECGYNLSSNIQNIEVDSKGFFDNLVETFYVPTLEDANQIINILSKSRDLDEIKIHGHTSPECILEDELWEN